MEPKEPINEEELRKLRDNIYGKTSDDNWDACKKAWMKVDSIKWLVKHQPKKK